MNAQAGLVQRWASIPAPGSRGVQELGNGQYLISKAGGSSAVRGLGTTDPSGAGGAGGGGNFTLIAGFWSGGWISPVTVVPEPATGALFASALALIAARRRRARSR